MTFQLFAHKAMRKIGRGLTRCYVALSKGRMGLNHGTPNCPRVIVSMTTYSARFSTVHRVIESLLVQFHRPDKVIIWLDEDVRVEDLPASMLRFKAYGVEFIPAQGRYKPHKKYLHAMEAYPEDIIITVDDDILYPPTLVGNLLKTYKRHPGCVCARRVHRMTAENGTLKAYHQWDGECRSVKTPDNALMATGVGGVLYPPHCVGPEAFNREKIVSLCLNADDVWLKCMELLHGTKVVWSPCIVEMPEILEGSQETSLMSTNVDQNQNDVLLRQVMNHYGIKDTDFFS